MRLLLAEDEKRLSDALCQIFSKNKFDVDSVYDGVSALEYARSGVYDLILLDIMMPKLDGISVLKKLRAENNPVPILMLTAKDELQNKVEGLDCGADDYMTKPFSTEELLARVRALTRRRGEVISGSIFYGDLELNSKTSELCAGDTKIALSLKEYKIMDMLIQNPEQILSKERILEKIWGGDSDAEYNNLEVFISFLRKKMRILGTNSEIKTSRGIGYSLVCK
ncbi:MAG: response regulator transcription factor [Spirochaetaceae bacterium]|nr:response regulator transcription factor [Spirochaetaceae bacterium]